MMEKLGNITLYNADCMEIMKGFADNQFDICIVDPPYGIGMSNSNKRTKPSRPNSYTEYSDFRYHDASWDNERPSKLYFDELFRVSKDQVIFGANYFCEYLPSGNGWLFWNKLNGLGNCFSDGEFAFTSKGIQSKYFECSAFDKLRGGKDRIHPTPKPVALYKWILKNYAKEGQTILDTHLGSGSSAIAAHDYGYEFTGIELDEEYYNAAKQRIINHQKQLNLF